MPNPQARQLEGRDHLVIPVVMLTEGVHNGSAGPVYYPAAELQKSATLWNGRPLIVYHPVAYGTPYAGDPAIFNARRVGWVFNARWDAARRRLLADAWVDLAHAERVDPRVLAGLRGGAVAEVSTGLYLDTDDVPGVHNGTRYAAASANYRPDHLALLPDQRGACSVAAGCGLGRRDAA